ncbi:alcohol dehydrogenase catalytic domain-containing protein [Streptomyces sp. NPDC059352]|uniref:alcohol dehydrogenase catalytic domain-containing protein n=1 Tax=Streptomyces sp. NPDC059352 TaxID=3346810 RepID=UPI0036ABB240
MRAGLLHDFLPVELPFTLGWDVSGIVTEVGMGVTEFTAGDGVVGRLDGGAGAEYWRPRRSCWPPHPRPSRSPTPPRCPWPASRPGSPCSSTAG